MSDFDITKERTLGTLLRTLNGQRDLSPKGFVDTPVLHILDLINSHKDYVSTSSCSGRIAVYEAVKDKGVQWLLVKHAPVTIDEVQSSINNNTVNDETSNNDNFLMLKCESFILHILCRDIHSAKSLLNIALECGYRESGITLGKGTRVMLAIRTTAFGLEIPLAINSSNSPLSPTILFSNSILSLVIKEANKKLLLNFARIDNFLNKLKKDWGWPKILLTNESNRFRRWGHSCLKSINSSSSYIMYGGYGVNNSYDDHDLSEKSSRKLKGILLNPNTNEISSLSIDDTNSMHSAVETLLNNFYIVSGGRSAPSTPLPCLVVYDEKFKEVKITEDGDIPSPRWGHSFIRFNANSNPKYNTYFLFGGRDADTIYGDAYILTCRLEIDIIHCTWSKLWQENKNISARFFHASIGLPDNINNSDHDNDDTNNISSKDDDIVEMILIHGGLLSLEEPLTDNSFLIIKPSSSEVRNMTINSGNRNNIVSRFAHTLTYIGKNTVFLIGGTTFNDHDDNIESEIIDSYRIDFVRSIDDDNNVSIIGDIQPLKIYNADRLPCSQCRCHHQVNTSRSHHIMLILIII
jgi:tRNA wybutosine-synthesizing protein 3